MKKRMFVFFMAVGILAAGCGKKEVSEIPEIHVSEENDEEDTVADVASERFEKESESAGKSFAFENFKDLEFYFASGAGGWRTVM